MSRRPVRRTAHPWGVIHGLVHLHHVINEGYAALRDSPHTEEATKRERVVTYFILHGIVESLGQVREALVLLGDMAECLADIETHFQEDLDEWTNFRDDSAHIIDRTHRVSRPNDNDAVLQENELGYDTDTLAYNWDTDEVRTGVSHKMVLRPAVEKVEVILRYTNQRIGEALARGKIQPPPRFP